MSYRITLRDPVTGDVLPLPTPCEATGVILIGSSHLCDVLISDVIGEHFFFPSLDGQRAEETVDSLTNAVETLGVEVLANVWEATPGNVGYTCQALLGWAQANPDGVWRVD